MRMVTIVVMIDSTILARRPKHVELAMQPKIIGSFISRLCYEEALAAKAHAHMEQGCCDFCTAFACAW